MNLFLNPNDNVGSAPNDIESFLQHTVSLIHVIREVPLMKHEGQLPQDCRKMQQQQLAKGSHCI
jgi:hypothetical protein